MDPNNMATNPQYHKFKVELHFQLAHCQTPSCPSRSNIRIANNHQQPENLMKDICNTCKDSLDQEKVDDLKRIEQILNTREKQNLSYDMGCDIITGGKFNA